MTNKLNSIEVPYTGPTLLELILQDVLIMNVESLVGKFRVSTNLLPIVTRAVFAATDELSNEELLRIIRPSTVAGTVGRDTKEARNLRSIGSERGLKINTIKRNVLELLESKKISNSDVVRSWAYAVIHEAARQTVEETRAVNKNLDLVFLKANSEIANQMLNRAYEFTITIIRQEFSDATVSATAISPNTEERRFLHYAGAEVLQAMDQPKLNPTAAMHDLLENVYREIDAYVFEPS